ncbi:MAG: hypothetical protein AAGH45_05115 [Pseudomonadota bacterium]
MTNTADTGTAQIPMARVETPGRTEHVWSLPVDEPFLEAFLRDLFETHYHELTFGPIVPGAAYELRVPGPARSVTMMDGYLTVHWGTGGHFHLCIGTNYGSKSNPNPPEVIAQRRPGRAELYRSLDKEGHPNSWGFRMFNGAGEQQITIFFPNPFITSDDQLADEADFSRLAVWDHVLATYAGYEPDPLDRMSKGFRLG